jgi:electron transfer flavoprotein alpha subunit
MNQDIYAVVEHLQGNVADISYVMLAAARALAKNTGGQVVGVLLGYQASDLASNLAADRVVYVDHPALADFTSDAYLMTLTNLINENEPRAVLFGNTSIGADLASVLSARLSLPIVNSCQNFGPDGQIISKICGGKIMAESNLSDTTTLITMIPGGYKPEEGQSETGPEVTQVEAPTLDGLRTALKQYIEPDVSDVDISKEPVLISVGRGIQNEDNIELAEELAEALGGVVSASRPVVDQGWLPTSRMVGKSGKIVKPKLYLAIGISGAPEHVEGITDSETIIAINSDPAAPIFATANYGVEFDLFDLVEVLIEKVEEAKDG